MIFPSEAVDLAPLIFGVMSDGQWRSKAAIQRAVQKLLTGDALPALTGGLQISKTEILDWIRTEAANGSIEGRTSGSYVYWRIRTA